METILKPFNLFWICLLLHLIADYTLQGCLADLKQKRWWSIQLKKFYDSFDKKYQTYELKHKIIQKYKNDYMSGLLCHAAMWSILTFLPLMFLCSQRVFALVVICNLFVHFVVDHMKANMHVINLNQDQLLHLQQIFITLIVVRFI